jgi:ribosomal protein S18 acetylase RimI-like enzyme
MLDEYQIVEILDELPSEVAWQRQDSIVIDRPYWFQVITPSSALIPLNGVYRTKINDADADSRIISTMQEFAQHKCPLRWIVTGSTRPTDFGVRLEKFGFKKDHEALGLAAKAADLLQSGLTNKVVKLTEDRLDDWVDAAMTGWGNPESFRLGLREDVLRALRADSATLQYFAAISDDRIVGTGALRICSKSGHMMGSSVRPECRGRGIYKDLVAARAKIVQDAGLELVTTHGIAQTSAPILKAIGFKEFSKAVQYSFAQ